MKGLKLKMYNIKENDLNIIKDILIRFVFGAKILVFGSRQCGTEKSYSDLDIAIDCGKKMDWILVADIREAFIESNLNFKVDVIDWWNLSCEFQRVILKDYSILEIGEHNE